MTVYWTETALGHLSAIYAYIAQTSPLYARRVVDRITHRSRQLEAFPQSGRRVPELDRPDVREVIEGPYRLIYRVTSERVNVLAVIHGARQAPWHEVTGAGE